MKRSMLYPILVLCALSLGLHDATYSQGKFGAGFVFGEPTGFAWKYRLSQNNALDGALGFSPFDRYRLHVDYLWQAYPFHEQRLSLHYGVGAVIGFGRTQYVVVNGRYSYFLRDQEMGFAARVPVGLSYEIPRSPIDLFVEVAPLMIFAPGTGVGIDAGLGVRFYP
ncbi:MAG: DUF3996 domain-containing protein [Ignavibacteria bacterium]|nr:DUF3996 domain-containing protein [Ignavibacteria bacterium]MBI3766789.1 DUF3996 domain-containing protein [Ignavibacteriales bacterium]